TEFHIKVVRFVDCQERGGAGRGESTQAGRRVRTRTYWGHPSLLFSGLALTLPFSWMPPEHKVIIMGLDNAGKTTILYQLTSTSPPAMAWSPRAELF
ncbi:hypothetical protein LEMLEM_LOCUS27355, partial [Lemmus lemmus]